MRLTGKEFKEYVVQLSDMPFDEAYNAVDELPIDKKQKHKGYFIFSGFWHTLE